MNDNINIDSPLWIDDVCLVHHDLEILQEMLDTTNHVALKYHIQNNLKLKEGVLIYNYLGEIRNNKGNLSDDISKMERKSKEPPQWYWPRPATKNSRALKWKWYGKW